MYKNLIVHISHRYYIKLQLQKRTEQHVPYICKKSIQLTRVGLAYACSKQSARNSTSIDIIQNPQTHALTTVHMISLTVERIYEPNRYDVIICFTFLLLTGMNDEKIT